jgi:hypothetical protein
MERIGAVEQEDSVWNIVGIFTKMLKESTACADIVTVENIVHLLGYTARHPAVEEGSGDHTACEKYTRRYRQPHDIHCG